MSISGHYTAFRDGLIHSWYQKMRFLLYPSIAVPLRQWIGAAFQPLTRLVGGGLRSMHRQNMRPPGHHEQQHFGTLDDQLLQDLGLQRSQVRAAEYGILPGDQALNHTDADSGGNRARRQTYGFLPTRSSRRKATPSNEKASRKLLVR